MGYNWDIFLSYPRSGQVGPWVHTHFLPVLRDCLDTTLPYSPRIFVDQAQPTGVDWPNSIKSALLESKLMIAVWTPPYFRSDWCLAEWHSMRAREKLMEEKGSKPKRGLIYPIVYSDGKHFDPLAKITQYQRNLQDYTYPYPGFKESLSYLKFHDAVREIAAELEDHLDQIPAWEPGWPVTLPAAVATTYVALPQI